MISEFLKYGLLSLTGENDRRKPSERGGDFIIFVLNTLFHALQSSHRRSKGKIGSGSMVLDV